MNFRHGEKKYDLVYCSVVLYFCDVSELFKTEAVAAIKLVL